MKNQSASSIFLMADDDADDCLLAKSAFEEAKIDGEIRFICDGRELMEYLQSEGEHIREELPPADLILLDLNMPRKDGREALKEIKSDPRLKHIPVVILSTSKEEKDDKFCRDLGVCGFMVKPLMFEEWIEAFKSLTRHLL